MSIRLHLCRVPRVPHVRKANLGFHAYDGMAIRYDGLRSIFISVVSYAGCNFTGKERDAESGLDNFGGGWPTLSGR